MIVGPGALGAGALGSALAAAGQFIKGDWNGFNVLHTAAARMAGLLLGYVQKGGIADIERPSPSW